MRNDIISSLVLKRMLHLVEDLDRVIAKWKATDQIGTKSTTSETKKREAGSRVKRGEEKAPSLWIQKKKSTPYFPFPGRSPLLPPPLPPALARTLRRTYLVFPHWKQLIVKPYICLSQRQTRHASATFACRANRFAREAQESVWDFCTWEWRNLQLSYSGLYLSTNGLFRTCKHVIITR